MWFSLVILIIIQPSESVIQLEQHFRPLGKVATGLTYAHLSAQINVSSLEHAFTSLVQTIILREKASNATVEQALLAIIAPQLLIGKKAIKDINVQFFMKETSDRDKRQILGFISMGMSIFNLGKIQQLDYELGTFEEKTTDGFRHVAHVLQEEDQAITTIAANVNKIKSVTEFTLLKLAEDEKEIIALARVMKIMAILNSMDAEIASWGRGLDSLQNGKLHPSLINAKVLKKAFQKITEKARKMGMRPLHQELSSIYKCPVSYISTTDHIIKMFVHVPLTEHEPLSLFEHLPIPQMVDNILLTVEGTRNILATDIEGRRGLEMSEFDLLRCQSEDVHNGKLYICPNTNLIQNNIRNSCLGSMFFGNKKKMMEKCRIFPFLSEQEFVQQVSENTVSICPQEDITVRQSCQGKITILPNITGLTTVTVPAGCKLVSEKYTFISPKIIDINSEFVKNIVKIPRIDFFPDGNTEEIGEQLKVLQTLKSDHRVELSTLNEWIQNRKTEQQNRQLGYGFGSTAIIATVVVVGILIYLFVRYRRGQKSNTPK
jgi:hypothetical protein